MNISFIQGNSIKLLLFVVAAFLFSLPFFVHAQTADVRYACPMIYAPVCGINGITYGNSCEAGLAHVPTLHEGACGSNTPTYCAFNSFGYSSCPTTPAPAPRPNPVYCPFGYEIRNNTCYPAQPIPTAYPTPYPTPYPTMPPTYTYPTGPSGSICPHGYEKYPDCFVTPVGQFNPLPYNPVPVANPNLCSPGYEKYPDCFRFPMGNLNPTPAKNPPFWSGWEQAIYNFIY